MTTNFVPPAGSTARQGSWGHAALTRHTCLAQNIGCMHRLGLDRGASLDVVLAREERVDEEPPQKGEAEDPVRPAEPGDEVREPIDEPEVVPGVWEDRSRGA